MVRFRSGFCAPGDRGQSRSGGCNHKLGNDLGTNLQQNAGVPASAFDICAQRQPALTGKAGIDGNDLGVRVRHYCFPSGNSYDRFEFNPALSDV
jgi:hypothetical protein